MRPPTTVFFWRHGMLHDNSFLNCEDPLYLDTKLLFVHSRSGLSGFADAVILYVMLVRRHTPATFVFPRQREANLLESLPLLGGVVVDGFVNDELEAARDSLAEAEYQRLQDLKDQVLKYAGCALAGVKEDLGVLAFLNEAGESDSLAKEEDLEMTKLALVYSVLCELFELIFETELEEEGGQGAPKHSCEAYRLCAEGQRLPLILLNEE